MSTRCDGTIRSPNAIRAIRNSTWTAPSTDGASQPPSATRSGVWLAAMARFDSGRTSRNST